MFGVWPLAIGNRQLVIGYLYLVIGNRCLVLFCL